MDLADANKIASAISNALTKNLSLLANAGIESNLEDLSPVIRLKRIAMALLNWEFRSIEKHEPGSRLRQISEFVCL